MCYLINTRFASGAAEGTVSAFFYAARLYEPLTTTLVYSVSIVLFPKFSQQFEEMEHTQYRQYVVHVLKNTLLLVLPMAALADESTLYVKKVENLPEDFIFGMDASCVPSLVTLACNSSHVSLLHPIKPPRKKGSGGASHTSHTTI